MLLFMLFSPFSSLLGRILKQSVIFRTVFSLPHLWESCIEFGNAAGKPLRLLKTGYRVEMRTKEGRGNKGVE